MENWRIPESDVAKCNNQDEQHSNGVCKAYLGSISALAWQLHMLRVVSLARHWSFPLAAPQSCVQHGARLECSAPCLAAADNGGGAFSTFFAGAEEGPVDLGSMSYDRNKLTERVLLHFLGQPWPCKDMLRFLPEDAAKKAQLLPLASPPPRQNKIDHVVAARLQSEPCLRHCQGISALNCDFGPKAHACQSSSLSFRVLCIDPLDRWHLDLLYLATLVAYSPFLVPLPWATIYDPQNEAPEENWRTASFKPGKTSIQVLYMENHAADNFFGCMDLPGFWDVLTQKLKAVSGS